MFFSTTIDPRYAKALPYALSLVFTMLIYGLHMTPNVDSMLNENNTQISHVFLQSQINYHQEIAPFARRPLTSHLMVAAITYLGLRAGHAFICVNFFFLFLSGVLVYKLSLTLKANTREGLLNMMVYFASFSILFAFFPPVFSFDEPLQYCCVLLAWLAYLKGFRLGYVCFFSLALVARETSLLLVPGMLLFLPASRPDLDNGNTLQKRGQKIMLLLPVLLYAIFILWFLGQYQLWDATHNEMVSRYSCFLENFESPKNTVESVTSLFLAIGPFVYLAFLVLQDSTKPLGNPTLRAFWWTVALNTPLVFLTAFARESRLFALPLLFIWPVFLQLFGPYLIVLVQKRQVLQLFTQWKNLLVFLGFNMLNYLFCYHLYEKLGLGENNYFTEYLFWMVLGLSGHYLIWGFTGKNQHGR